MIAARSRAQEFGAVAQEYDRLRSAVPTAALDWITPLRCRFAVELGAGTGLSTRRLARLAGAVLALEPDSKMRAVFPRGLDNVQLQAGTAESIPVADSTADLAVAFDAWHWFEQPQTTYDAARVLRTGGFLGAGVAAGMIRKQLATSFEFRHQRLPEILAAASRQASRRA